MTTVRVCVLGPASGVLPSLTMTSVGALSTTTRSVVFERPGTRIRFVVLEVPERIISGTSTAAAPALCTVTATSQLCAVTSARRQFTWRHVYYAERRQSTVVQYPVVEEPRKVFAAGLLQQRLERLRLCFGGVIAGLLRAPRSQREFQRLLAHDVAKHPPDGRGLAPKEQLVVGRDQRLTDDGIRAARKSSQSRRGHWPQRHSACPQPQRAASWHPVVQSQHHVPSHALSRAVRRTPRDLRPSTAGPSAPTHA